MDRIRILRVITWLPVGGIERKIVEVLPRLDRSRFEVSLVCLREMGPLAEELAAHDIPVSLIKFRQRWDFGATRRLTALMKKRDIDVVHSHMYRSNVPATVAAHRAGVKAVWAQVHNVDTWETRRQLAMDRFACRWRTGMIAVSREVRHEVMSKLNLPEEKVRLIYNGVDTARFGTGDGRAELRSEWKVEDNDLVFLMAARLVEQKRPQDFLEMARHLMNLERGTRGRPRSFFCIAGDGQKLAELKALAATLPIPDRVIFLGQRDDVPRVMNASDVFIMTSTKEGFSNALVEALASGLAIVATNVGGNAEAVRDGKDGVIIPASRLEALHRAADSLVAQPALRDSLRTAARERAREFSLNVMVRHVEALYAESAEK
jgi:glycosyltransferase involved in cell wall biosynthesis